MRSLRLLRNVVTNYLRSGVAAALAFGSVAGGVP